ncbi:MAG TPA: GNAT family N-acetyltransferase [Ignavibacteria bacterium]
MIIETDRLLIRPLKLNELIKYVAGKNPFEDLNITFAGNEIDEHLRQVLTEALVPNLKKIRKDILFYTLWLAIDKKFCMSIGSIMFKGKPDSKGKVEIGYGTHEEFQNKGYMTEAVEAFCKWAFDSGTAKIITAETAKDNPASFKVLEKNNFIMFDENDKFYYWKKIKDG